MNISVIGLGYVGLPLALVAAQKGLNVTGVDKNKSVIASIAERKPRVNDRIVKELISSVDLALSESVTSSDAYIVCVPTPVNLQRDPDLKYVVAALQDIAAVLSDDQIVIIESTINPGVCEEVAKPILDQTGKRYYLAHCPERINPGDATWTVRSIPRVVGGIDEESARRARELYEQVIDAPIEVLSQIRAAEATKILENTFRDVNIAFVNEMAMSFHRLGIDISEVIRAASTKPFGFLPHYPGVGVGGHCIAVDPYYMINRGKEVGFSHDFLIAARRINSGMPGFVVSLLQDMLNDRGMAVKGTVIALLGVSYKPNVSDNRESPFYDVYRLLDAKGAQLVVWDPYIAEQSTVESLQDALSRSHVAFIITAHDEFLAPELFRGQLVVVDGRNCLDRREILKLGVSYCGVGISPTVGESSNTRE